MKRNWFTGLAVVVLGLVLVFSGCQKKATLSGVWSGVVNGQVTTIEVTEDTFIVSGDDGVDMSFTSVGDQLVLKVGDGSFVLNRAGDSSNVSFNNVDEFLKQYEKVIVSIEKAAKSKKAQYVLKFSSEATALYSKAQTLIADNSKWNTAQLAKLTALAQRAAEAAQNMY
jgi:hypothetical protein